MSIEKMKTTQDSARENITHDVISEEKLPPDPLSYIVNQEEFLSAHEEMFKMGQAKLVDEDEKGYRDRVEGLWEKRREQLLEERKQKHSSTVETEEDTIESEKLLEKEIKEKCNEVYFARRGHLSDDLFAVSQGADPDSEEPVVLFEKVRPDIGEQFDAHGIDKGDQLSNVLALLCNGVDSNRDFYTAPFEVTDEKRAAMAAAVGTSGGTAYKGGLAVVTGGYGESIVEHGIKHVFINDVYKEVIPLFQKRFPHLHVHALSEQKKVLEEDAERAVQNKNG